MAVQTDKLRRMFDADSKLMLETLKNLVGQITTGAGSQEVIDRAFRAAHSIKSEAGFLQLGGVSAAAHSLEESLSLLRNSFAEGRQVNTSELHGDLNRLSSEIDDYRNNRPAPAPPEDGGENAGAEPLGSAEMGMLREARGRGERLYRAAILLTCDPEFVYPRAFLVVNNLEMECGVVQVVPPLESLKTGGEGRLGILVTTAGSEESLRRLLNVDEVEIKELSELSFEEVANLVAPAGEQHETAGPTLHIEASSQEEIQLFADEVQHLAAAISRQAAEGAGSSESFLENIRRLAAYSEILRRRVDWTSRVQLLDVIRDMRQRSVAHAARNGKRIRFEVGGGGAVVFTAVADALTDALLHLVRNSIDHGIETIEQRAGRGKPPAGTIRITVERMGESVRVRLADDGVGINERAVRDRTGDTERSLLDVLASPGFTMKTEADESSGRGVGLDSVVHTIRDLLSGGIELRSQPGKGTLVTISVPITSRLVNVMVVDADDGPAAIPSALVVDRCVLSRRRLKKDSFGGRYYDYRGQTLALVSPFGSVPSDESLREEPVGIVVRCGDRNAVLVCTEVLSSESVVRDEVRRRQVFVRILGREIPYVFPPSLFGS